MLNENEKARLKWNCRRGMLELDLILQKFLQNKLNALSRSQFNAFSALLESTDPQLYAWLMGQEEPSNLELAEIVAYVRTHS